MRPRDAELLRQMRIDIETGEARRLREEIGLISQVELSRILNVSSTAVSRWENGIRTPQGKPALTYARLLAGWRRQLEERGGP
jgi:DNA-binding transcriptional regulator YiaG